MQYGNFDCCFFLTLRFFQFKSYYVVWKLSSAKRKLKGLQKFKSYYVVWKHGKKKNCREVDIRFKSYYVVWKPEAIRFKVDIAFMFKSYYVVWKPRKRHKTVQRRRSLNRTMQYGNERVDDSTQVGCEV